LYGHIANDDLKYLKVGDSIAAGQKLCHLGNPSENVGWHPNHTFNWFLICKVSSRLSLCMF